MELSNRELNFVHSICTSDNDILQMCGHLMLMVSASSTSNSINFICDTYSISKNNILKYHHIQYQPDFTSDLFVKANSIRQFLLFRQHHVPMGPHDITTNEIDDIIYHLGVE